ncbi:M23 family metallopeptidase [Metabacillus sediminilitoris]|uniref:M23 family metallopeptidase n=1 Tax=Metabacillus sediminilitoris TaxID=2567941 RepID=A0A4S4C2D4_9BACI|nr:M23 family metallopeptidase [Metabacillus sediminilitoris]QGQ47409.1 peptidoglycan DD-metalloendopeptidase family protein [Metabacillus sediminilitoris]THF81844.1 M23 family metallopeptidase [Metabacillus sediminilitoris]
MSHRADEVRKRIAKRKRDRGLPNENELSKQTSLFMNDEEKFGVYSPPTYEAGPGNGNGNGGHPLFSTEVFIFKLLLSAVIVLVTAIAFKNGSPLFKEVRSAISYTFEEEFQFAAVSTWYRDKFGEPLALFEPKNEQSSESGSETQSAQLSVPASGKVLESFEDNGQGIMVETDLPSVEAMNEGIIIEAGEKADTGLTIVLQHADGTKSWYGNLDKVDVALYDFVEKGKELGKIKLSENQKGTYYFAIKKGDDFIDPNQVIQFE